MGVLAHGVLLSECELVCGSVPLCVGTERRQQGKAEVVLQRSPDVTYGLP